MEPASLPTPLYFQLKEELRAQIRAGRYGVDGRLPTEHELCALHGLSRTPVARALGELADEGVVVRQRKRGTFVNPRWVAQLPESENGAPGAVTVLRVLGSGEPWAEEMRRAAGDGIELAISTPDLHTLHDVFLRAIAEGAGPDLAVLDSVWIAEFARAGFLTPLDELDPHWIADEHDADFLPAFAAGYRFDGHTLAVQAPSDVTGLWYRRAAVRRIGAEPPSNWDELLEVGRALARSRPRGHHVLVLPGGPRAAETTTYALVALLAANGATVLAEDHVTLDSPAAVETLRFLRGLVDDGVVSPEVVGLDMDGAPWLLAHGRADLCVGASYQAADLAEWAGLSLDRIDEEFGFIPMPHGPHGGAAVLCGGMAYVIPRQARHPQQAMKVLRSVLSTKSLVRLCLTTGQLPPRHSALQEAVAKSAFHASTGALFDELVLRPSSPVYALVSARIQAMAEDVLSRRRTPAAALARAADMISAITGLPQG